MGSVMVCWCSAVCVAVLVSWCVGCVAVFVCRVVVVWCVGVLHVGVSVWCMVGVVVCWCVCVVCVVVSWCVVCWCGVLLCWCVVDLVWCCELYGVLLWLGVVVWSVVCVFW